ncbi:MAG: uL15m family ribosomal protein [Candidatus Pacearchaeota archaeon]
MSFKTKKTRKSKRQRGNTTHGHGARKKWMGSGHRGGKGMAGTGKRADQKKTLINKLYGDDYFGKQGITSKGTKRKKDKWMNLDEIQRKFSGKEIELKKYKILGNGELNSSLTITAKAFTKSAKEKIEKAGGKAILAKEKPAKKETKKKNNQ